MNRKIGEILISNGLITLEQFESALDYQRHFAPNQMLGQILCELGFLSTANLSRVLDYNNKRIKLGEMLVKTKQLDQEKLDAALSLSRKEKIPLGKALTNLNFLREEQVARAVATQYDLPLINLRERNLSSDLSCFLNPNYAMKHRVVVIERSGKSIVLAMAFPLSSHHLRELETVTQYKIQPVIASDCDIAYALEKIYGDLPRASLPQQENLALDLVADISPVEPRSKYVIDYNVDFLFKRLLSLGVRSTASDIHLENNERGMQVRFRIDGVLQSLDLGEDAVKIASLGNSLVSKIKILCELDITERRRPQDGSFRVKVTLGQINRNIDFRVSVVPTRFGENVVIRILDKIGPMSMETIGFAPAVTAELTRILANPTGIILVTGPTGSGKTSTLYAILALINRPGVKILTVEDPIEYSIDGICQSEVNEAIGNSFAEFLRAFLRQDPDHIMVGEIRDLETAAIAIRASLTGHTVLSTLHTNDATSVVPRIIDLGIEPTLVSATLRCVIAQRLIRINCKHCSEPYVPDLDLARLLTDVHPKRFSYIRGKGCSLCNFTGFSGRKPIVEMWIPSRDEALLINHRPDNTTLREEVFSAGQRMTMFENGIERVRAGETTVEELMRVIPYEQISEYLKKFSHS